LEEVEAKIQLEHTLTIDKEVDEATTSWVSYVGNTRARETKYWKTIELYWHIKTLLGQMLQMREDTQNTIQLQLDGLHLLLREALSRLPSSNTIMISITPKSICTVSS
jgi:hypothetical protein